MNLHLDTQNKIRMDASYLMKTWGPVFTLPQGINITVQSLNAKISKMSKRRQKIAFKKRAKTIFTDCYPVSVSEMSLINDGSASFGVTFEFKESQRVL